MAPVRHWAIGAALHCLLLLFLSENGDGRIVVTADDQWSTLERELTSSWRGLPSKLCYSCASENYKNHWDIYQGSLRTPSNFTVLCRQPYHAPFLALTACSGPCVTIIEDHYIFGVQVDHSYIRGCADAMFLVHRKDFVPQAMLASENFCNLMPRKLLFKSDQRLDEPVTVCFCAGDRCNVYPDQFSQPPSAAHRPGLALNTLLLLLLITVSILLYSPL